MMVLETNTHGLTGDLENLGHIPDKGLVIPTAAELVEAALDHGNGHQEGGAKHVGLDLHVSLPNGRPKRGTLAGAGIQSLM